MKLQEMTFSTNAGTNLIPSRLLRKTLRRPNLKWRDYVSHSKRKKNARKST